MKKILFSLVGTITLMSMANAQDQVVKLYNGKAPGSENWTQKEGENFSSLFKTEVVYNITDPTLLLYKPAPEKNNGTVIIIAPGGGYQSLSINREGIDLAKKLVARGTTALVLKYRLNETKSGDPAQELLDAMKDPATFAANANRIKKLAGHDLEMAIRYVRTHAKDLNVSSGKLGVIGFSAGASVILESVLHSASPEVTPNFAASIYGDPDKQVLNAKAPNIPLFVCVANDDQLHLTPRGVALYSKWYEAGYPAELHVFEKGGHGFGMGSQQLPVDHWYEIYELWLSGNGF